MANENDLSGRVGLDTTNFKAGVSQLNDQIKAIETGFRASAAVMGSWSETSDGLKMRVNSLNDKLALQKQKLSVLTDEYKKTVSEQGASSKAAASLASQMYSAEKAINATENDLKKYNTQLDTASKKMEKLADKMQAIGEKGSKVGSAMTVGVTAPIVAAGAASFKLASDLSESINKVDVAFGGSANNIKEWSKTTIDKIGLAQTTALDMVAAYGDMGTSMGGTTKAAADLGKQLVERAADMASYKNISIDVASTGMQAIFTGETESLKKLGVVMTEANLKAYALANGYKKSYDEMSQWEKVQLRASYVIDATNNSAGDFARTSDQAANQTRLLKERVKELGTSFGEDIAPAITPAINSLNNMIKSFGSLDNGTKKTIITVAALAAGTGPVVLGASKVVSGVGKAIKVINSLKAASVASATATAATASAETAAGTAAMAATPKVAGLGVAFKSMLGPIGIALAAITAVGVAFEVAANKAIDSRQKLVDDQYDGLIEKSDKYYQNEIDNLENQKNAHANALTETEANINKYYDKASEAAEQYVKDTQKRLKKESEAYTEAHKKRIKELEEERKLKNAAIDAETNAAVLEVQSKINAIDAKTEAEEQARKNKENAEKLQQLKLDVDNARTIIAKQSAEKALADFLLQLENEKTLAMREKQKQQLQDQIDAIKMEGDKKKEAVNAEITRQKEAAAQTLQIQQQSVDDRLEALDGYVDRERERLELSRANLIKIEQQNTATYVEEIDKRIAEFQRQQKAAEDAANASREAANAAIATEYQNPLNKSAKTTDSMDVAYWLYKILFPSSVPKNASGTNDWKGGITRVNEEGGEILNLPRHTQIIPHDVSMEAARAFGRQQALAQSTTTNYNHYGAMQEHIVFQVGDEVVTNSIKNKVSFGVANTSQGLREALGYGI